MLIRRLTLVAFALFATATTSLALVANAAEHAAPALADQRDHGQYQRHNDSRRSYGENRRNNGRYNDRGYNNHGRDHGHNG